MLHSVVYNYLFLNSVLFSSVTSFAAPGFALSCRDSSLSDINNPPLSYSLFSLSRGVRGRARDGVALDQLAGQIKQTSGSIKILEVRDRARDRGSRGKRRIITSLRIRTKWSSERGDKRRGSRGEVNWLGPNSYAALYYPVPDKRPSFLMPLAFLHRAARRTTDRTFLRSLAFSFLPSIHPS